MFFVSWTQHGFGWGSAVFLCFFFQFSIGFFRYLDLTRFLLMVTLFLLTKFCLLFSFLGLLRLWTKFGECWLSRGWGQLTNQHRPFFSLLFSNLLTDFCLLFSLFSLILLTYSARCFLFMLLVCQNTCGEDILILLF